MAYFDLKSTRTNTVIIDTKLSSEEKTILKKKFLVLVEELKSKRNTFSKTGMAFVDNNIKDFESVDESNIVFYYTKYVKECPVCRKEYLLPTAFKFCSEGCKKLSYCKMDVMTCTVCGRKFYGYKEINKNPICSNRCIQNKDILTIERSLNNLFGTTDRKKINNLINNKSIKKRLKIK